MYSLFNLAVLYLKNYDQKNELLGSYDFGLKIA